jgi:hypothetical protein
MKHELRDGLKGLGGIKKDKGMYKKIDRGGSNED